MPVPKARIAPGGLLNSPAANTLKGAAAGLLGFPGDMLSLMEQAQAGASFQRPKGLFDKITSDALARQFGADLSRPSGMVGLIGAPDPGDIARLGGKGLLAMTLFHGTPHRFDKFDLKAIGTGEGAQGWGHGLYFAEDPKVAGSYQSGLSRGVIIDGVPADDFFSSRVAAESLTATDGNVVNAIDAVTRQKNTVIANAGPRGPRPDVTRYDDALTELRNPGLAKKTIEKNKGHLYEVDIPDETIGKMLDWDAPLSEQPESVRKALSDMGILTPDGKFTDKTPYMSNAGRLVFEGDATGADLYHAMAQQELNKVRELPGSRFQNIADNLDVNGKEAASRALNEAGIPGIRFYDGSSRAKGEGTRNIVVFNPDDITSVKRDGELVFENKSGLKPAKADKVAGDLAKARGLL